MSNQKGFTLIELLVVIGILAVLLAITLIAINPARQFSQTNNTKRSSDVNAVLNAINQYMVDNRGQIPTGVNSTANLIRATGGVDLCSILVPTYIAALPVDPTINNGSGAGAPVASDACTTNYNTGYAVQQISGSNRLTVSAPGAELSTSISITR